MNLIVLAAGRGRRLYPLTRHQPKALLDIGNGVTLLGSQLDAAAESATIDKVYIVAGHLYQQIEAKADEYRDRLPVDIIFNPYFDVTNALFSLWTAHYVMSDRDFMISNGDNFYRRQFFDQIADAHDAGIAVTISRHGNFADDDMKVQLDSSNSFRQIGKRIPRDETAAISVGCLCVKGVDSRALFHHALIEMVKNPDNRDAYWQAILNHLADGGAPLLTTEIPHSWWAEVDLHPDAELLRKALLNSLSD